MNKRYFVTDSRSTYFSFTEEVIYSYRWWYSIENGLKQGDALSPLFFNFAAEYAIRRV
jgi:hypothetical protein